MRWLCFGTAVLMSVSVMQGAPRAVAPSAPIPATSEPSIGASAMQETTGPRKARRSDRHRTESSKKTRRPAARGSVDVTPPRIDRLTPTPGRWIVDNLGLREIQIGFTEAVATPIPAGAITIWTVGGGAVTNFTTSYEGVTDILTVSFASPITDDRLTIVVDFAVADIAGNELDGEIADPMSAVLPSGNGVRGGQAVFRINILQGDANRDGVVDGVDGNILAALLGRCTGDTGFDPTADLNLDGCVNIGDVAIFRLAEGRSLPATDGIPPIVTAIREPTNGLLNTFSTVIVDFDEVISGSRINERTCFLVDGSDNLIVSASGVSGPFGRTAVYNFVPPLAQCGTYTINISNALADPSGELLVTPSAPPVLTGLIPPPAPTLNTHTAMTTGTSVTITGSAPGATLVEVSCPTGVFTVPLTNDAFTADITLAPDSGNAIFFTALSTCSGVRSPPVMTTVTHDTQPPEIFIDFPADGAQITTATTDVAGRVGDMLSGFMGLTVTVNGTPAIVDVGIGNNGTFFLQNVPLGPIDQPTVINAIATDELGNTVSKQITATRVDIPAGTSQMTILSGNAQTAPVMVALPAPVVVQMFDTDGVTPFVNKVVTFKVTRSDGRLSSAPGFACIGDGTMMLQCHTDSSGLAKALWTMGHDAGCGNNRVEVTSMSIEGTVAFCASATAATASQLNIGSGNNQRAEAGGPAPQPLRVWVSDGQNPVVGQSVLFTVTRGGGLVNGQATTTVATDMTGHAEVGFTLGPDPGNNAVEATVVPDPMMLQPARFVTFGVLRNEANPTSFIGVVLNNAMQPIEGATCTLTIGGQEFTALPTDVTGRFTFDTDATGVPQTILSGPAHLMVEGSTAFRVGGSACSFAGCTDPTCVDPSCADSPCCVTPGTYPALPFNTVIIPNAVNTLPTPVLLPPLETTAGVVFDNMQDITLTLLGMDGLEMLVRAGAARHPDGTIVSVANPVTLMLSQVHADDIPMPIPDGASPPFAWTLQPSGTTFNPPIEITYPNMSGLPAGSIAYFLSFNHATSRFQIVATGHVTDDGSQIISDPGAGLTVAGWGCNCPPYSVTGDCCSGCNDECCEGTCCCGVCCAGTCCDGVCCAEGGSCCGGVCCDGPCCNGVCCPPGQTCVDGVCCDGPMCGGKCCSGSESCCGGQCCDGVCCEGLCCPAGGSCCDGKCCDGLCCEGQCCGPDDQSCCNGQCCAGACCEATGVCCPAGNESCCNDECCNGPCCEGNCCAAGESCCGDQCCPAGENCCGGACCDGDCCDGVCCPDGGVCCNGQCCPPGSESCCNAACCGGPCCNDVCCSSGESCCGAAGCCAVGQTCCGDAGCCPTGSLCCEASGGGCCPQGTTCCGEECCPVGIVCCDGACCPAGQSCCGGDTCCDPDKCCDGECCAQNETCCNGVCEVADCSLAIDPTATVCAGTSVVLTLVANCQPDCKTMGLTAEIVEPQFQPPLVTVSLSPRSVDCGPVKNTVMVTITTLEAAPPGVMTVRITGKIMDGVETVCERTVETKVTIFKPDLDVDSNNDGAITDADDLIEADPFSPDKPGKWGWTNNDDSDGDGFADNQNNTIDGAGDLEDIGMLVVRSVDVSNLSDPKLLLRLGNTGLIRVFRPGGAGATAILGPGLASSIDLIQELGLPVGWTLGMEGVSIGTTTLTLTLLDGTTVMCDDTVRVTIIELDVTWETAGANPQPIVDPNNHPSGTLGFKVFPGATAPGGGFNDVLAVKVSTTPQVANVPVFLKAFDPDDPSANNDVVDGDLLGGDNRDTNHQDTMELGNTQLVTDANGEAMTTFRVAHQPGDNHRVAATIKQTTQGTPTLNMLTDNNVPPSNTNPVTQDQVTLFIGQISPLLTAWRTLHVETDTMVRPIFAQNTFTMNWDEPRQGPAQTQVVFEVDDPGLGGFQSNDDQFNNGWVELTNAAGNPIVTARIVGYTTDEDPVFGDLDVKDEVTINIPDCGNGQSGLVCLGGVTSGTAVLSDDDLSVEATFTAKTWGSDDVYAGPIGSLLPPDLAALQLRYHPAYIDPVQDMATSSVQGLVTFLRNQGFGVLDNFGKDLWDQAKAARNLCPPGPNCISAPDFWTVMVVSAWQEIEGGDFDPNTEVGDGSGIVLGINTHDDGATASSIGASYTGICTVFRAIFEEAGMNGREQFTVAHEIGHTLGLSHGDGGLMCAAGNCQTQPFTATSLKKLRDYDGP